MKGLLDFWPYAPNWTVRVLGFAISIPLTFYLFVVEGLARQVYFATALVCLAFIAAGWVVDRIIFEIRSRP